MGMTLTVRFPTALPTWAEMARLLSERGYPVQMRMIDGELAFPDEEPSEPWKELRIGTPGGMVTLRREANRLACVVWGNSDASLRQGWHALAWVAAHLGGGQVETETGLISAEEFQKVAELPEPLRS
jgi:hypothetical protein